MRGFLAFRDFLRLNVLKFPGRTKGTEKNTAVPVLIPDQRQTVTRLVRVSGFHMTLAN